MFAIASVDKDSGKLRYVRDDSGESLWSTLDQRRAKTFDSADEAQAWADSLRWELTDRLLERKAGALSLTDWTWRYLEDPCPAWLDDPSLLTPAYDITPESVAVREPQKSRKPSRPASPSLLDKGENAA